MAVETVLTMAAGTEPASRYVQLATSLQGVVTQQLVPVAAGQGRAVAVEVLVATGAGCRLASELVNCSFTITCFAFIQAL